MTKHFPLTPGIRAAIAAGQHLRRKDAADPLELIMQKFGDHADEIQRQLKSNNQAVAGVRAQMDDMEQKMARGGGGMPSAPDSWGEQFTKADGLKAFSDEAHTRPGRLRVEVKAITNGSGSAGALGWSTLDPEVPLLGRRRLTIRNLIPTVQVSSNLVEYARQVTRPIGAATVAEGAQKPESSMTFEGVALPTQVIAHWVTASRQVLDDIPYLRSLIDSELRYGLGEVEEGQLLNGNGTSPNLLGIIPQATPFSSPIALADMTLIDQVGAAVLQNALADFPADGIVMHPSDWMRIRLLKDASGWYLIGDPTGNDVQRLFGLPVVATKAMPAGNFLVGNFQVGATIYDRWAPIVEVSTQHADYFTRNLVAILAEERLAFAVKQPTAFTYGAFDYPE
ncbi:phage major capsid protein [Haematobacter genomosp. 1]|uniref:Phage major capsid protein n=1 Tax=Haematobacter genomosp. 1 TaxID=366618 RepID=A0A212AAG0_9RHOB|nr:phage major capsid protein [Haematobacter genomosp. 1]OWJ76981.1 phage major capsid protein [Haematobacter genomosp. 1]